MSLDIESLAVEPELANGGVWKEFAGASWLIGRYNNEKANSIRSKQVLENLEVIQAGGEAAEKLQERFTLEVLAKAVLLGWKGVTKGGEELEFSEELAYQYLSDPRFSELRNFIENTSVSRANFQHKNEEEVVEQVKDSAVS